MTPKGPGMAARSTPAHQPIRLSATGGGPGGGWSCAVEFQPTPVGHAVWVETNDSSEIVRRQALASEKPLTWRAAAEDLLKLRGPDFSLQSESLRNLACFDGVPTWAGNLLLLLWLEDEDGFYYDRKFGEFFLKCSDEDLRTLFCDLKQTYTTEYFDRIGRLMFAAELLGNAAPSLAGIARLLGLPPDASLDQIDRQIEESGGSLGLKDWFALRSDGELIAPNVLVEAMTLPSPSDADVILRVLHSWCAALKERPELEAKNMQFLSWVLGEHVPCAGERFAKAHPSDFAYLRTLVLKQQPPSDWNSGSLADKRNAHARYAAWSQVAGQLAPGPMK